MKFLKEKARKASEKLAKYVLRQNVKPSPVDTFNASWESLFSNRLYRWLVQIGQNPDREGTQLHGRTFELLSRWIPGFYRSVQIGVSGNLKEAIEGDEPFLVAHIHEGHRFISRIFDGRELTRIVENPKGHIRWLFNQGIDVSRFHVIQDDVMSLMHLREAVRAKHAIICAIDYTDALGRRAYINPAIFGFANGVKMPVFFVKSHVSETGTPEMISAGPYIDIDPTLCGNMFLDFFNTTGRSRVSMTVKRYGEHSDWKSGRRLLDAG